jgi:hypothetical protein
MSSSQNGSYLLLVLFLQSFEKEFIGSSLQPQITFERTIIKKKNINEIHKSLGQFTGKNLIMKEKPYSLYQHKNLI